MQSIKLLVLWIGGICWHCSNDKNESVKFIDTFSVLMRRISISFECLRINTESEMYRSTAVDIFYERKYWYAY